MASHDVTYNTLNNDEHLVHRDDEGYAMEAENDTPQNSGIMIHIVPEENKASWNHIEDLDSFFTRMYYYHQKHGFIVIVLDEFFQLFEFGFVIFLVTFMSHCIKYPVLFGEELPKSPKISLSDVIIPPQQCLAEFGAFTFIALIVACLLLLLRLTKVLLHVAQYWDIKKFYNTALKISDNDLDNITWYEVQKKLREVQSEQQMCIHKEQLTELDIYHRILRFKNYLVALMNKNLLPVRFSVPVLGDFVCLSRGLLYNIELILFRGPWSPFENNWQLREDLTVRSNRTELARRLSRQIMWVAVANFILSPFVFLWQLTYISFSYATILRKEPGSLGVRTWSNYGKLYLRHFNELDHELDARLNRAYEPADKYMSSFSSPVISVIAKNILFICGGILVVILLLGIYEEHVFQVEHVLTIATILTGIGVICRVSIPDENLIWCPEQLLTSVLAHVHYLPSEWRGLAHTTVVRKEFGHFFQFKAMYLMNELLSPIITPFILLYVFRPRSLDLVDFFRSFTVSVVGVGNVCSFAQMDVRKHGNPDWQLGTSVENNYPVEVQKEIPAKPLAQGEHGKIELSLLHFTLTNPEWKMPNDAKTFIQEIKHKALEDLTHCKIEGNIVENTSALTQSLMSFGSIGEEYSSIAHSVLQNKIKKGVFKSDICESKKNSPQPVSSHGYDFEHMLQQNLCDGSSIPFRSGFLRNIQEGEKEDENVGGVSENTRIPNISGVEKNCKKMGVRRSVGRLEGPNESLLNSLYGDRYIVPDNTDVTTAEMCLSMLYIHELHHRQILKKSSRLSESQRRVWRRPVPNVRPSTSSLKRTVVSQAAESTPLLPVKKS